MHCAVFLVREKSFLSEHDVNFLQSVFKFLEVNTFKSKGCNKWQIHLFGLSHRFLLAYLFRSLFTPCITKLRLSLARRTPVPGSCTTLPCDDTFIKAINFFLTQHQRSTLSINLYYSTQCISHSTHYFTLHNYSAVILCVM